MHAICLLLPIWTAGVGPADEPRTLEATNAVNDRTPSAVERAPDDEALPPALIPATGALSPGDGDLVPSSGPTYNASGVPGTPYCPGDGTGTPCPCGNNNDGSNGIAGCAHFDDFGGAKLTATGPGSATDFGGPTVLHATGLPPQEVGLFFQGTLQTAGGFGLTSFDGLDCCGGDRTALYVFLSDPAGNASSDGSAGVCNTGATSPPVGPNCGMSLSVVGGAIPGDTRCYQYWFRTPGGSFCGTGANFSNGYEIAWNL